ncbi:MAG TPA: M23 family metallopeptidase [Rhodospirillales bacterium]
MTARAILVAVFLVGGGLIAAAAAADTLRLDGPLTQGGLVVGHAEPGARVALDGNAVKVSADGVFLLGFGRDAPAKTTLRVAHPDGSVTERELAVAKRAYDVQRIDGLPERQVTPSPEDMVRIRDDNRQISQVRAASTDRPYFVSGFAWPAAGKVSGVYGSQRILNGKPRRPHNGIDVVAPLGTPVVACADGVVALVNPGMFFTGKTVMIDHGHGLTSVYVHMDDIRVRTGDRVRKGTRIGSIGMTGRATGPHLHWGVSLFNTHLDPALLAGPMAAGGAERRP